MTKNILFFLSHNNQVANITLNRPNSCNAFDITMIEQLDQYILEITNNLNIKLLVITANGKHFSAGADLNWMKNSINYTKEQNLQDAKKLSSLLFNLYYLNKLVICGIQGNVYGGAIGIAACADLIIAADNCNFCFSEVKFGLAPAIISQFIFNAMDQNFAKYHMLTAKPFNIQQAANAYFIDSVTSLNNLSNTISNNIEYLLSLNFEGILATKKLLNHTLAPISKEHLNTGVQLTADLRTGTISQQLINLFLKKHQN